MQKCWHANILFHMRKRFLNAIILFQLKYYFVIIINSNFRLNTYADHANPSISGQYCKSGIDISRILLLSLSCIMQLLLFSFMKQSLTIETIVIFVLKRLKGHGAMFMVNKKRRNNPTNICQQAKLVGDNHQQSLWLSIFNRSP